VGFSRIASYAKWIADLKLGAIPQQTPLSQKTSRLRTTAGMVFCLLIWLPAYLASFMRRHPVQTRACAMAMSKCSWEPPRYSEGNKPPPSCYLSAMSGGAGWLSRSRSL